MPLPTTLSHRKVTSVQFRLPTWGPSPTNHCPWPPRSNTFCSHWCALLGISLCKSVEQQLKRTSLYKRFIDAKDYFCVAAAQRSWTVHRWSARCCPSCWRAAQRVWRRSAALHWRGSWALLNRMLSWLSSTSASSQAATTSSPITLTPTGGTPDDHMT